MLLRRIGIAAVVGASSIGMVGHSSAIDIVIDYTYDTGNFFNNGSTNSTNARNALEAAAGQLSSYLDDTFSAIQTPDQFASQTFGGITTWTWSRTFFNPWDGSNVMLSDQDVAADTYIVYAGARSLSGNVAGLGGGGGFSWTRNNNGGFYTSDELNQIAAITDDFSDLVETRGEAAGYSNWGGSVTFDSDGSTNWWYDHTTDVGSNSHTDFYSVALHELIHTLGFGGSDEWNALIANSGSNDPVFTGAQSVAVFGGNPPIEIGVEGHWREDTESLTFMGGVLQETAMDPNILNGTRKYLTELDAAGLEDLGWTVIPEPTAALLLAGGIVALLPRRRA
ncbi:MAG: hypothetical protein AAGA25_05680 [Planctomycetota bacterium]